MGSRRRVGRGGATEVVIFGQRDTGGDRDRDLDGLAPVFLYVLHNCIGNGV